MVQQEFYYFDTSSLLDLDAYGLTKRLSKVKVVIVPEVMDEILDRNLKRRLKRIAVDRGPQKRATFVPGLDSLQKGERAIIRSVVCDRGRGRRIYVSKDTRSRRFIGMSLDEIGEEYMDTSGFVIRLHEHNHVTKDGHKAHSWQRFETAKQGVQGAFEVHGAVGLPMGWQLGNDSMRNVSGLCAKSFFSHCRWMSACNVLPVWPGAATGLHRYRIRSASRLSRRGRH